MWNLTAGAHISVPEAKPESLHCRRSEWEGLLLRQ